MALVQLSHKVVQPAPYQKTCSQKIGSIFESKLFMHLVLIERDSNI